MNRAELISQRRQTSATISADPIEVRVRRITKTKSATGGWTESEVTLRAQTFTKKRAGLPQITQGVVTGGHTTSVRDLLIGQHDADIQADDRILIDGVDFEVVEVSKTAYRKVATIRARTDRA